MWFILTLWGPGWGHFAGDQRPGPSLAASLTMMPHLALYLHTWCPPPWGQLPRWTHLGISVPGASRVGTAPIPPLQRWQESGLRYPFTNPVLCMWGPFSQIFQNPAVCKPPPRAAWEHLQPFCFTSPSFSLLGETPAPSLFVFVPILPFVCTCLLGFQQFLTLNLTLHHLIDKEMLLLFTYNGIFEKKNTTKSRWRALGNVKD